MKGLMAKFTVMLLGLGLLAAAPARAQEAPPDALAKRVTDEVLAVLRTDKDIQAGNTAKVIDLVEKKVLPHFDFVRMTRLAVGGNWRQASPDQQKALVEGFRTLLVHTYASTFTAYRNQTIEYRPLRIQPEDTDVVVTVRWKTPEGLGVQFGSLRALEVWALNQLFKAAEPTG